jgi:alanyl-tRNA synthetase
MTSHEIRQSFLDFFKEKQHTIVPSSPLLPDAPNLLFTNAGMNQFVPYFLGQQKPPWNPPRAADTQKCIRAGGKHNDLEDVGQDTYHHTFFEMLGNWSFGDYFKREAIDWAWELLVERWKFPKERLYATYFGGDDKIPADTEARDFWLQHLPAEHVKPFGRKDNFWMMGDTGPCGPCSEIHFNIAPEKAEPQLQEIWNLVFIQFNANADGSFSPLPAKHVDTGMGFERVCGIIQCTNGLKDFSRRISNYETDVFRPIFDKLEQLSGKKYAGTLPTEGGTHAKARATDRAPVVGSGSSQRVGEGADADTRGRVCSPEQIKIDVAFRVIADHIRCLSFAIADGILPSNEGRGYVLRRILRRAVRYGRNLGFHEPFFYKLADVVAENFGQIFPEVRKNLDKIRQILRAEEESFNRTLDRGLALFEEEVARLLGNARASPKSMQISGEFAFKLYDTYGFPLDLTELMARERGLTVDVAGFEKLMDEQRARAREDYEKKKSSITIVGERGDIAPTKFVGYDFLETDAVVLVSGTEVVLDQTPFYAEAGGQVGDTGVIGATEVLDTQKQGDVFVHRTASPLEEGQRVRAAVDAARRGDIQRHHTVTHLFHWALHEVVSRDARQRGSLVAPDRLRFDFNHPEKLTAQQLADIERLVNERIKENAPVFWFEMPFKDIKGNPNVMQFFGEKYGDIVRVVQIGGREKRLDGFSMELCGGTHTKTTGDIGFFKIAHESAIAAGVRRIEAVCGKYALEYVEKLKLQQKAEAEREKARELKRERARKEKSEARSQATAIAERLLAQLAWGYPQDTSVSDVSKRVPMIAADLGEANAELLRAVVDELKPKLQSGVVILGGIAEGKANLICFVTPDWVKKGKHAGKIVGELAKICGGGGGGRPDLAQAGGKNPEKLGEALKEAARMVGK